MVVADLSIFPIGEGTSLSRYVKEALSAIRIKHPSVKVVPGPMTSALEANTLDEIFQAAKVAHQAVLQAGAKRVLTTLKVDERLDKPIHSLASKLVNL